MSEIDKGTVAYYEAIMWRLDEYVKGKAESYIDGDILYLFLPLSKKDGSDIILNAKMDGRKQQFKLQGILETYDSSFQQKVNQVYCCCDQDIGAISVNEYGRVPIDVENRYELIYQKVYPNYRKWKEELDNELIFSYLNWEITCSCLPTVTPRERNFIKKYDGAKAIFVRDFCNEGLDYCTISTSEGNSFLPAFCFRKRSECDLSTETINQDSDLQNQISLYYAIHFFETPRLFVTPAYVELGGNIRGLALVSVFEENDRIRSKKRIISRLAENGSLQLESPILLFPEKDHVFVHDELIEKYHYYWPSGYLAGNKDAKVYAMYYKQIEEFCEIYLKYLGENDDNEESLDNHSDTFLEYLDSFSLIDEDNPEVQLSIYKMTYLYQQVNTLQLHMFYLNEKAMEEIPHLNGVVHLDKYLLLLFYNVKNREKLMKIQNMKKKNLSKSQAAKSLGISIQEINQYWGSEEEFRAIKDKNGEMLRITNNPNKRVCFENIENKKENESFISSKISEGIIDLKRNSVKRRIIM